MQIISVVIHFPDSPRPIFAVPFHALRVKCIYLFTARNDSPSRYYQFQPRNNHVAGKRGRREREGGSGVSETKVSQTYFSPIRWRVRRENPQRSWSLFFSGKVRMIDRSHDRLHEYSSGILAPVFPYGRPVNSISALPAVAPPAYLSIGGNY